jgi:hypothetical protein
MTPHDPQDEPQQQPEAATTAPGADAAAALDSFTALPSLAAAIQQLSTATADPAAFLQPSSSISDAARAAAKALYTYALQSSSGKAQAAGELHVEQPFDVEQIWLQLELSTEPLVKRSRRLLKRVGEEPLLVPPEVGPRRRHLPAHPCGRPTCQTPCMAGSNTAEGREAGSASRSVLELPAPRPRQARRRLRAEQLALTRRGLCRAAGGTQGGRGPGGARRQQQRQRRGGWRGGQQRWGSQLGSAGAGALRCAVGQSVLWAGGTRSR